MTEGSDQLYERLLILRCQAGDQAAFAELVQRYHRRIRYYVRKMVGNQQDAEDILQEIWFAVFRGLPRLVDPASFPGWLYRIARNLSYGELRRRQPQHRLVEETPTVEPLTSADEFSADEVERIHRGLDELSPQLREVLILRFLEEMRYEEIAKVIGAPVGTVRSRIYYGKRALREALERLNPGG